MPRLVDLGPEQSILIHVIINPSVLGGMVSKGLDDCHGDKVTNLPRPDIETSCGSLMFLYFCTKCFTKLTQAVKQKSSRISKRLFVNGVITKDKVFKL